MNSNIVIIWDDFIVFNTAHITITTCGWPMSVDHFISKLGLVLPIGFKALGTFYLEGLMLNNQHRETDIIDKTSDKFIYDDTESCILSPSGKLIVASSINVKDFSFASNAAPIGRDLKYVINSNTDISDTLYSIIEIADSAHDAFDRMVNALPIRYKTHYRIFRISELIVWINKCLAVNHSIPYEGFVTKPLFRNKPINISELS